MLRAYANGGHYTQTLELYLLMRITGVQSNHYSPPSLCASESFSPQGKLVSWDIPLVTYTQNGLGSEALLLFDQMLASVAKLNPVTALIMVSACAYLGSWQHGRRLHKLITDSKIELHVTLLNAIMDMARKCFADMTKFSVIPEAKRYACMVDLLGRAGLLYEDYDLIKQKPSLPNDGVWGAVLLACKIHGNTDAEAVGVSVGYHKSNPQLLTHQQFFIAYMSRTSETELAQPEFIGVGSGDYKRALCWG
ncbi:tetratricopeptide repeat (TPR)-like superfamily protein [Actinidia rufa]|uniref:Tetratricopeptide repeat (TPR)-like superfamily protein n=1 Tax=Actinidia rufa TaxID=165716 RepID=A0A7J0EKA8_9ERIC|nr:tetratricopeptide repeat (TPR)-like superfamily protein [Actinidia rufa]